MQDIWKSSAECDPADNDTIGPTSREFWHQLEAGIICVRLRPSSITQGEQGARMISALATIIAIGGLGVAILTFAYGLSQNRGKRFHERSVQLLDLQERFIVLGPVTGDLASDSAFQAHEKILAEYGREARANAALYLLAVSRLRAPGSYVGGLLSLMYAVITAVITGSTISQLLEAGPVVVIIVSMLPGLATLLLIWSGARLMLRRDRTRVIRGEMGEVDPVSKEGRRRFWLTCVAATRGALRWLETKSRWLKSLGSSL